MPLSDDGDVAQLPEEQKNQFPASSQSAFLRKLSRTLFVFWRSTAMLHGKSEIIEHSFDVQNRFQGDFKKKMIS